MQDIERELGIVEHAIRTHLGPASGGFRDPVVDPDERISAMARSVVQLSGLRAARARIILTHQIPVVRVRVKGPGLPRVSRTVTAGMSAGADAFVQLVRPVFSDVRPDLVRGLVEAVRAAIPESAARLCSEVRESVERLMSSPEEVNRWKHALTGMRADKVRLERENLVAKMASLLNDGWTMEQLHSSVSEATCRHVMNT